MSTPKNSDEQRREMIGQLEDEKAALKAQKAKAKGDVDKRLSEVEQRLKRAESPPDDPELCLICWVDHGERLKLVAQSSLEYGVDIFRCSNGHERRVRHR